MCYECINIHTCSYVLRKKNSKLGITDTNWLHRSSAFQNSENDDSRCRLYNNTPNVNDSHVYILPYREMKDTS